MDGRVQLPVIKYLQNRFSADYIDTITEIALDLILAEEHNPDLVESILQRPDISVEKHDTKGIAVVGHYVALGIQHLKKLNLFIFKKLSNFSPSNILIKLLDYGSIITGIYMKFQFRKKSTNKK